MTKIRTSFIGYSPGIIVFFRADLPNRPGDKNRPKMCVCAAPKKRDLTISNADNVLHDLAVDIGEAEVAARITIRKSLMIEA